MPKKHQNQSNRQQNIHTARERARHKDRIVKAQTQILPQIPDELLNAPAEVADGIQIVDLPEDSLAGKAMQHIDGTVAADSPADEDRSDRETPMRETREQESRIEPEPEEEHAGRKRRQLPLWGKVVAAVAIVLVVLIAIGAGLVGRFLSRIGRPTDTAIEALADGDVAESVDDETASTGATSPLDTMDPDDITWYGQSIEPIRDDDIKNILLIGQDRREKESRKRSDAMIIVSLNQETGDIKLCSFLRDTYVQIEGYGGNKLNRAYELGGMELLDQTIEDNFGVHIDNNVEVDFFGFVDAMSVIGNLDIELSQEEIDFMEAHPTWADDSGADVSTWDLHAGVNSMRPEEYAVYCRLRMVGNNDMERTERQRRVLTAAFKKVMSGGILYELSVADAIIPYITTDMTNGEILGYVYTVVTKGMDITSQYRIPYDGTYEGETIDGASVVVCDMEANALALQEYLYGDLEGDPIVSEEERAAGHGYGVTTEEPDETADEIDSAEESTEAPEGESAGDYTNTDRRGYTSN